MSLSLLQQWGHTNITIPADLWECPLDPVRQGFPSDRQAHAFTPYFGVRARGGTAHPNRVLEHKLYCPRRCSRAGTIWQPPPSELPILRKKFKAFLREQTAAKHKAKTQTHPTVLNIVLDIPIHVILTFWPVILSSKMVPKARGQGKIMELVSSDDEPVILASNKVPKACGRVKTVELDSSNDDPGCPAHPLVNSGELLMSSFQHVSNIPSIFTSSDMEKFEVDRPQPSNDAERRANGHFRRQ
ncbi:hypothetical protein DFH08DRAFT_799771 [Mycena albidolilacea]|uniref:Uncharacterized protein n=1 Tax=Mycena albidolilacea TaxID=1033008 RepID=A0AAD7AMG4_9AGAR|nr:hypothetical protein DFH08DRAFT_799771 [Mycena albidolilacea]